RHEASAESRSTRSNWDLSMPILVQPDSTEQIDVDDFRRRWRGRLDFHVALPRLLHLVWVGSKPPSAVLTRAHSWASLNPAFDIVLWDNPSLLDLAERRGELSVAEALAAAVNPAAVTDVARFFLLDE